MYNFYSRSAWALAMMFVAAYPFSAAAAGEPATVFDRDVLRTAGLGKTSEALLRSYSPATMASLKAASEAGDSSATCILGIAEVLGIGIEADLQAAEQHLLRSARAGVPQAAHALAHLYLRQDQPELGLVWLMSAAKDVPSANFDLAYLYEEGKLLPRNVKLAMAYRVIAADGGDAGAQDAVVERFALQRLDPGSAPELEKWIDASATRGFPPALYLKSRTSNAEDAEKIDSQTMELLEKLAKSSFSPALHEYGLAILGDLAPGKTAREGIDCLVKAANAGWVDALNVLLRFEKDGADAAVLGSAVDVQQVIQLAKTSLENEVEHGDPFAALQLARILVREGAAADEIRQAVQLLRSPLLAGSAPAMRELGILAVSQRTTDLSPKEGEEWLKAATLHGDAIARVRLAELYRKSSIAGGLLEAKELLAGVNSTVGRKMAAEIQAELATKYGEKLP